jgi:SAM-dependent methyltransferase
MSEHAAGPEKAPVEYNFVPPSDHSTPGLAAHLGGHGFETHTDDGAIDYLIKTFNIKSAVDIGCGPGGVVKQFIQRGIDVVGIDGDHLCPREESVQKVTVIHDYTVGPYKCDPVRDLAWCVEFVEHVEKKYMPNFIETFKTCKYVTMTHAFPGQGGHHHVNCMPPEYWVGAMEANGFELLINETNEMRKASTMAQRYIRQQGLIFRNINVA